MGLYRLDKTVVRVCGNAEKFLMGLSSNTLDKPQNAFLNMHGRIVATFEQVRAGDDEYWLVVQQAYVDPLLAHLERYARLSKTLVERKPSAVYFDCLGDYPLAAGDLSIVQRAGKLILTDRDLPAAACDEAFTLFRLEHFIPFQGVDYTDDMVLNVHEHDFVAYTKGCFLGQEPVAKVHNRSKPTWKLVVCDEDGVSDEQKTAMTSKAVDPKTHKVKGFVFIRNQ